MATREIPYLVCDSCGTEAAGEVKTRIIKLDRREVENDFCPKCDDKILGKIRALMAKGRRVAPAKKGRAAKVA